MFDLNPLHSPQAPLQHLIMVLVTILLGFIIGYVSRRILLLQLEEELQDTIQELDDCQTLPVALSDDEEEVVLNRIRARAGSINVHRIGYASRIEADDLKEIVGIGPFLEKKLHALEIYTFRQIANFTPEDIHQVNEIIEFFPGRIERDNWVGQAAELARKKYRM